MNKIIPMIKRIFSIHEFTFFQAGKLSLGWLKSMWWVYGWLDHCAVKTSVGPSEVVLLGCVVGPVNSGDPLWGVSPASGSPRPKPKPLFRPHTQICQYKGGQLPPILSSLFHEKVLCVHYSAFSPAVHCYVHSLRHQCTVEAGLRAAGVTSQDDCVPHLPPPTFKLW